MADEATRDLSAELEEVRNKVRRNLERANGLICDARRALDQQEAREVSEKAKELAD